MRFRGPPDSLSGEPASVSVTAYRSPSPDRLQPVSPARRGRTQLCWMAAASTRLGAVRFANALEPARTGCVRHCILGRENHLHCVVDYW